MAHLCIESSDHHQLCKDGWTLFTGTWYRSNCAVDKSLPCCGCKSTGGIVFKFHDGAKGTEYTSVPPYGHLYCFMKIVENTQEWERR